MRLMRGAREAGDVEAQAQGALLLARSQWVASAPVVAFGWSESAQRLALQVGDEATAAAALSLQSCAASAMGQPEAAVRLAKLSLDRCGLGSQEAASATNYLAAALVWNRQFEQARQAFDACVEMAREFPSRELGFQPLVNRCLGALLALGGGGLYRYRRSSSELDATLEQLHQDLQACGQLLQLGQAEAVNAGTERIIQLCYFSVRGQLMLLRRRLDAAYECLQICRDRGQAFHRHHWVRLFVHWLEFEYAQRLGQPRCAMVSADAMELAAARGGHEGFRSYASALRESIATPSLP